MKIKSGILGTRQVIDSKEDRERVVRSKGSAVSEESDTSGVQLSSDSALIQSFREAARGQRLDIPAGTAIRFEPGDSRDVNLIPLAGARRVIGFNGLINGPLDA